MQVRHGRSNLPIGVYSFPLRMQSPEEETKEMNKKKPLMLLNLQIHKHFCLNCKKDFACNRHNECNYYKDSICDRCFAKYKNDVYDGPDDSTTRRVNNHPDPVGVCE